MSESVKQISQLNEIKDASAIVDFWAPWCGPCKMLAPELDKAAETLKDQVGVYKINIDDQPELAQQFGISGVPTVLFMKDGKEVTRIVGFRPSRDIIAQASQAFTTQ